jgi:hypothetical protein
VVIKQPINSDHPAPLMGAIPITVRLLCIKLASSNPSCVGPPLPLQPRAFSHRHLQHTFLISLSIVIISSSTPVPTEPQLPHLNSSYRATAPSPSTSPCTNVASSWPPPILLALVHHCPSTHAPSHTGGTTRLHHQLEHRHCLFINSGSRRPRLP